MTESHTPSSPDATPQIRDVSTLGDLAGPRDVERLRCDNDIDLVHTTVGDMDNNCWLLCRDGHALLIDAAADAEHLLSLADACSVTITDVLTTHQHHDHVRALEDILTATQARHHTPRLDDAQLPCPGDRTYGTDSGSEEPLDLASEALAALNLRVVELRGHTPGGLAVIAREIAGGHAWVGDSVFPGGVGKTSTDEEFRQLLADVSERIFTLPDPTALHPGHGSSTTVGTEKPKVDEWSARGW